ncbi:MAG: family 1 glycosylhydrolase, partial [Clostridia bacterium]|nr:family 1 glycosylhydrolase [Clostridia bacterium]
WLNVWDVGSMTEGRIFEGHQGHVGCDHFHRFREDVALMKELGIKHYRLSINWSRLLPHGVGKVSEEGEEFYLSLFRELNAAGITPWVTLFHWDYPYELYQKGGWLNSNSPAWFEEYAQKVATCFGQYVENFILINEPQCFIGLGHSRGGHAPFLKLPDRDVLRCCHNVLLACGRAEKAIRKICGEDVKIGISEAYWPTLPFNEEDVEAARNENFLNHHSFERTSLWLDPLVFGKYPADVLEWMKENDFVPPLRDMSLIRSKLDFIGFNTYTGDYITVKDGKTVPVTPEPSVPKTDMRWNVHPDCLYYGPKFLYERYGLPLVCTENGVALAEWKDLNGKILDYSRIDFLKRYLRSLSRAADEVPIQGYFQWSFIDNFEWAEGFSKKFGLVHVDYETGERTPKESANFYKQVIATNGEIINN